MLFWKSYYMENYTKYGRWRKKKRKLDDSQSVPHFIYLWTKWVSSFVFRWDDAQWTNVRTVCCASTVVTRFTWSHPMEAKIVLDNSIEIMKYKIQFFLNLKYHSPLWMNKTNSLPTAPTVCAQAGRCFIPLNTTRGPTSSCLVCVAAAWLTTKADLPFCRRDIKTLHTTGWAPRRRS